MFPSVFRRLILAIACGAGLVGGSRVLVTWLCLLASQLAVFFPTLLGNSQTARGVHAIQLARQAAPRSSKTHHLSWRETRLCSLLSRSIWRALTEQLLGEQKCGFASQCKRSQTGCLGLENETNITTKRTLIGANLRIHHYAFFTVCRQQTLASR